MTIHYQNLVHTERIGGFFRLLFRWRGSIYSHVYGEISIWLILYYVLNLSYRFAMGTIARKRFEIWCRYCAQFTDYIPITFIVGFYVIRVIVRRWTQWENMPWPEKLAFDCSVYVHGDDVKSRMIRRTILRYCNLASILCLRDICVPMKKRFPTIDHLLVAGLITPKELEIYGKTSSKYDINWWIPFHWAYQLAQRTFQEGKVGEGGMMRLHDGINDLRNRCWVLFMHDWIPIPMVYTQVCTLSVYLYMLTCLFGRQLFPPPPGKEAEELDLAFPIFTLFQLMFYLGWLKVAEVLINPLGLDADDFDMNYIIDRNLRISYTVVDYGYQRMPPLERDVHWDTEEPKLPHTEKSKDAMNERFIGSTANLSVSGDSSSDSVNDADSNGANGRDDQQLIMRKTSKMSNSSNNNTPKLERFNLMAARFKRMISRQPTVSSVQTYDEAKGDALRDLLSAEEGQGWKWSSSPDRSPISEPKGGRFLRPTPRHLMQDDYAKSTGTLPRIEEGDQSNENTLTKISGAPLAPRGRSYPTAPPGRIRMDQLNLNLSESEQNDALLDLLSNTSGNEDAETPTPSPAPSPYLYTTQPHKEEGSRFTTAQVMQDAAGQPVGSALMPTQTQMKVGTGQQQPTTGGHGLTPASESNCSFEGGGRFDMTEA